MKKIVIVGFLFIAFVGCCLSPVPETTSTIPPIPDYGFEYLQAIPLGTVTNYGLAWDGTRLLAAYYGSTKALYAVDVSTGAMTFLANMTVSGWVTAMCYANGTLYVQAATNVYSVDPSTGAATKVLVVGSSQAYGPSGLASDGANLYSSDRYDGVIRKYSISNTNLVATFPLRNNFDALRESTFADGYLWVMDSSERLVYGINPDTGAIEKTFAAPILGYLRGMEKCGDVWYFSDNTTLKLFPSVVKDLGGAMTSNPQFARIDYRIVITNNYSLPIENFTLKVAVPQTDLRQEILQVYYSKTPESVATDAYGQSIATIRVDSIPGSSTYEIDVSIDAKLRAIKFAMPGGGGNLASTPAEISSLFTGDHSNLNLADADLQAAAASSAAGVSNTVHLAWSIRETVLDRMSYLLDSTHESADVVWNNATGSCSEYSYVFTALTRIDGFSTRFIGNTIFSPSKSVTNADGSMNYTDEVYHRFVELYFPEAGWAPIDVNREDSSGGAPYTTRLFLGYDQNILTFSKTFFDENYLGDNYTSAYSYSRGANTYQTGMVIVEKLGCWTVVGQFLKE